MATVVTYLLVSNPDDPAAVRSHPILEEHGFEPHSSDDQAEEGLPALQFAVTSALEESSPLEEPCRRLSAEFPEAAVTVCEVEERFDHVEHLRSVVFIGGQHAGEIEHGYVLNIGT